MNMEPKVGGRELISREAARIAAISSDKATYGAVEAIALAQALIALIGLIIEIDRWRREKQQPANGSKMIEHNDPMVRRTIDQHAPKASTPQRQELCSTAERLVANEE